MATPSDRERLNHIAEAISLIEAFTDPLDYEDFRVDHKTRLSVERLLEIIGEAAHHVSQELRDAYPDVPWRQITDLRNVVSHEYFQIRLEIIWEVIMTEVPSLAEKIRQILQNLDHNSSS